MGRGTLVAAAGLVVAAGAWMALRPAPGDEAGDADASRATEAVEGAAPVEAHLRARPAGGEVAAVPAAPTPPLPVVSEEEPRLAKAWDEALALLKKNRPGDALALPAGLRDFAELATKMGPDGGIQYAAGSRGDTSVVGWIVQAVEMAREARIPLPDGFEDGLRRFLATVWKGEHRFGYTAGTDRPSLYAVGMLMGLVLWEEPDAAVLPGWREWLVGPAAAQEPLYGVYYGVRVAIRLTGTLEGPWTGTTEALAKAQDTKEGAAGSFASLTASRTSGPRPGHLARGGVALVTAVATLPLEHALYLR